LSCNGCLRRSFPNGSSVNYFDDHVETSFINENTVLEIIKILKLFPFEDLVLSFFLASWYRYELQVISRVSSKSSSTIWLSTKLFMKTDLK
jgi:hypothetical protein